MGANNYVGEGAFSALYKRIKDLIDRINLDGFVKSINGKSGSSITIEKGDVGLGNVDNTADADKHVAHAATAGDADTLDGKHAADFMLKTEHEGYASDIDTAITNLDSSKVDKESGKGLSSNDFTDNEKQKLYALSEELDGFGLSVINGQLCVTFNS